MSNDSFTTSATRYPSEDDVEVVTLPNGERWAVAGPVGRYVKSLLSQSAEIESLKRDVNTLNEVLRLAGWGQGEIDSTAADVQERLESVSSSTEEMTKEELESELRVADRQIELLLAHFGFGNIDDALNSTPSASGESEPTTGEKLDGWWKK